VNEAEWVAAHLWIAHAEAWRRRWALSAIGVPLADARQEAAIGLIRAYRSTSAVKDGACARMYARRAVQNVCDESRGRSQRSIGVYLADIELPQEIGGDSFTLENAIVDNEPGADPLECAPRDRVGRCLRLLDAERAILGAGFNDEQIRLVAFVLLGMSYVEIAEAHGVSRQAVQQQAKRIEIRLTDSRNDPPVRGERAA
jgi:DNA-directed RNA polymerase specialized sigma24 family protein